MNKLMIVLYLKSTGHVLTALTLSRNPDEKIPAKYIAGQVFQSRYILGRNPKDHDEKSAEFSLESLETSEVDFDSKVFSNPYVFFIYRTEQGQDEIHNVRPGLITASDIKKVKLENNNVTVTLELDVTGDTTVWVQIINIEDDNIITVSGQIKPNAAGDKNKIELPIDIDPTAHYHVLTLVSGRPLLIGLNKTVNNQWP